jgi:hypothetical protein
VLDHRDHPDDLGEQRRGPGPRAEVRGHRLDEGVGVVENQGQKPVDAVSPQPEVRGSVGDEGLALAVQDRTQFLGGTHPTSVVREIRYCNNYSSSLQKRRSTSFSPGEVPWKPKHRLTRPPTNGLVESATRIRSSRKSAAKRASSAAA